MKKSKLIIALLITIALSVTMLAGCGDDKPGTGNDKTSESFEGNYSFGGSTTVEPVALAAIEAFADKYPDAKLSYDSQGSSVGVQGVLDGVYSLGGASRELKDTEVSEGAKATPVALDGIAVIVNGDVGIDNLTVEQVAKIFAGEIKNWKDVGGADKAIVVINRDEASGTRGAFLEMVLEKKIGKEAKFIANAITVESNGDMTTKVGSTPDSIGYCGFGYLDKAKDAGGKAISIENVEPTTENVLDGTFPISRKLNIVHKGDLAEGTLEKAFVDFLLSEEGQDIAEDEGFIKLK